MCLIKNNDVKMQTYLTLDLGRKSEGRAAPEMCCHSVVLSIYSGAEEGFKNGEAGYSSLSETGETHRESPEQIRGYLSFFLLLLFVAVVLGPAREAFGQLSDTFLNLF